jgi:hypothetical protein
MALRQAFAVAAQDHRNMPETVAARPCIEDVVLPGRVVDVIVATEACVMFVSQSSTTA